MTDSGDNHLGVGIVYHALIPFEWHPANTANGDLNMASHEARSEANEQRLRTIAMLNEYQVDSSEELQHLEFKMNLLLEIMGEVLASQLSLPPKNLVNLSAVGLSWQDEKVVMPESDQEVVVDLYLHPQYPKPVSLPGRVKSLEEIEPGQFKCQIYFDEMPEGVSDLLEKLIFTHHRREVAHSRKHKL